MEKTNEPRRKFLQWIRCSSLASALILSSALSTAEGAGLLVADGGLGGALEIEEHSVHVTLNNGVAVTNVTQVFRNLENRPVEALYTFPVPRGASVSNFSMWINGKEMVGEVVEKKRAREIYESYKRRRVDPGILEQVDYRTFEMRVFPIGPLADQKVEITYYQELDHDNDWATYVYPLATVTRRDVTARTKGKFALSLEAKSAVPIVSMESPSHGSAFVIVPHNDSYYQASLETNGGDLSRDLVVAYKISRPKTGIDLIASKTSGEDGYFCLTLTTGEDLAKKIAGMDYVFVLDVSGSMEADGKLRLSRSSIGAFVSELGAEDRFEVITFNIKPNTLFGKISPVTDESKDKAIAFLSSQEAKGGTVLNPAINTAYKYSDPDRTLNVVILSDGLTEQSEQAMLHQLIRARPRNARVFCIGVGNDVNRPLLEQVAAGAGGLASFISQGDNFERQAKAFRRKLTSPVATNVKIELGGATVYDVEPKEAPNLYHGSPVRLYGRYKGDGKGTASVRADVGSSEMKQSYPVELPREDLSNPEIERMWAWHKVDRLLKEADRDGGKTKVLDEVIAIAERYSIVTEYTSFLVLENDNEYQRWKIERRNLDRTRRDREAREKLLAKLESLRNSSLDGLGPQAGPAEKASGAPSPVQTSLPTPAASRPPSQPRGEGSPFGTGPVGPVFLGLAAWLLRKKRKAA
jgi:Ca-activated chloride channel family protein